MPTLLRTGLAQLRWIFVSLTGLLLLIVSPPTLAQVDGATTAGEPAWRMVDAVMGIPFGKDERFFKWEARSTRADGEGGDVVLKLIPTSHPQCQRWYRIGWTFSQDISLVQLGNRFAVYLTAQLYNESNCETFSAVGTSPAVSLLGRNGDTIDPSPLITQIVQNDPDPTSRAYLFYATHPAPMVLGDPQPSYPPNQVTGDGSSTLWIGGDTDVSKAFARTANGGSFTITIEARGMRFEVVYLYERTNESIATTQTQPATQTQTTAQPEPVQTQPEPVQTQPVQPEPVQTQPEPVQTQPEPVQTQPEPVQTQPVQPEPVQTQPEPVQTQPEPVQPQIQDPTPQPAPVPRASAIMDTPVLQHNVQNNEGVYFIGIQIPGTLEPAGGTTAQIMIQFLDQQNQPLPALAGEVTYRSPDGFAMTASESIPLGSGPIDLGSYNLWMPYYALSLPNTNGETVHELKLYADIYIDNQFVARSTLVPFSVRW